MNIYIKPAELVGAEIGDEVSYYDVFGVIQTAVIVNIVDNNTIRVKESHGWIHNIPLHRLVTAGKEYKVGDRVERGDYENLPVGTILRELDGRYVFKKNNRGEWDSAGSSWAKTNNWMNQATYPREIVYLP